MFLNEIRTQFGISIRVFANNNSHEYLSDQFYKLMTSKGLLHQTLCPHTPQQDGVVERKKQTSS